MVMTCAIPAAGDIFDTATWAGAGESGEQEHILGAAEGDEVLSDEIVESAIGTVASNRSRWAVGTKEVFEVMGGSRLSGKAFEGVCGMRPQQIGADIDDGEREFESFALVDGEDIEVIAGEIICC